jgi:nucleoside-diphosphate-sugar epimerase
MIFGAGFSGRAIARRLIAGGVAVSGTTRSEEKAARLAALGVTPLLYGGKSPSPAVVAALHGVDGVVVSAAPDEEGDPVLRHHGADIAAAAPGALVYLSTIGVYGDQGGAWIDEATPVNPTNARSRERIAAEEAWTAFGDATGIATSLHRLAGIYGPGRNAFVNLQNGTARRLVKPGQVFNRIHVEDIAAAAVAALEQRARGPFNVTDDEPAPPQDVVTFAAGLMGVEPPPEQDFATAELTPMARSFYGELKRVRNGKLKRELGVELGYPDYRTALARMWREGTWRPT